MSVLPAPEIEGPICLRTREKPPPSTARGGDGSRWESFAGTVPGGGKRLGPPGHPKAPPQPAPREKGRRRASSSRNRPFSCSSLRFSTESSRRSVRSSSNSFSTRGHWRQPHPEEGYSFDCSRITPRPNSNHSGETSKMVHTLMINAKSGILAPRSYLPSVVSGVRRRVANSLCVMAPRTAFSRSCNDSIGSVHPKPAAPLLFSGRAHHRIVVSGSGRKIPFLIDNNPKMVNKGRGRLRNDVTTELYRTPTK